MTDYKETINTYNRFAQEMSQRFRTYSRLADVQETFERLEGSKDNPKVLEIGCADGRDAVDIIKLTNDYLGIDVAANFIKIARELVPDAKFEVADALTYEYPSKLDVIFCFASLLHFTKEQTGHVFQKSYEALMPGGLVRISLKQGFYGPMERNDKYGKRLFYLYDVPTIQELITDKFEVIWIEEGIEHGQDPWLELILRKI